MADKSGPHLAAAEAGMVKSALPYLLEPTSYVRRTEDFLHVSGVRSLIVAKFVPGFSTIAPPLAGTGLSVPQYRSMAWDPAVG
jgi:membrane protein DedA with SNARE-associated domain